MFSQNEVAGLLVLGFHDDTCCLILKFLVILHLLFHVNSYSLYVGEFKMLFLLCFHIKLQLTAIHAQESAFEELLPYRVDWLNASFCRETTDGHFIVAPGAECIFLKMSQEDKVEDEMIYRMDTVNNFWTWFSQLIDIPNDPSHSCFYAIWNAGVSGFTPVLLDDGDFLLPARVYGISHYGASGEHNGVGLWKLNANGDVLKRVFMDVYDVNSNGMNLEFFYNTQNPLLVQGNDVYLIYSPRGLGFIGTPLRTVICKFDTELNLKWKRWYGEAFGRGVATGATLTRDGGCLISGFGGPQAPYTADAYVLKITSDGYCSVKENKEPLLRPYCFFPNPVDDQLHLEFSPDVQPQTVEIYDIQGRLVRSQGKGLESIDLSELPSGAFTLRIVMENGTSYSDKMVKQ